MTEELRKAENACVTSVSGRSLKAYSANVFAGLFLRTPSCRVNFFAKTLGLGRKLGRDYVAEGNQNNVLTYSITNLLTVKTQCAFTMAEILLSLTIIGVVAAITLPSLNGNINERTWNTQRKALYARMSQAISLMPSLNSYGVSDGVGSSLTNVADTATETFITAGLSKVLKINNVCDPEHLADCGIVDNYKTLDGGTLNFTGARSLGWLNGFSSIGTSLGIKTKPKSAAFETANGESVLVDYNPYCQIDLGSFAYSMDYYVQTRMCVNFLYDLNGKKGPNTVGKDIGFISILYPTDSVVVAPMPSTKDVARTTYSEASKACTSYNPDYRMPNFEELSSIFYNKKYIGSGSFENETYRSSSLNPNNTVRTINFASGLNTNVVKNESHLVRCVKR